MLAKQRLRTVLAPDQRASLGRELATRLVEANDDLNIVVVSDDDEVALWARELHVGFLRESRPGLNQAVASAHAKLREEGTQRMIVAHSDLASASSLSWVNAFPGITIAPDRRNEGTNVLALPVDVSFTYSYGPQSFRRHYREAIATGLPVRVVADRQCATDLDAPSDLRLLRRRNDWVAAPR